MHINSVRQIHAQHPQTKMFSQGLIKPATAPHLAVSLLKQAFNILFTCVVQDYKTIAVT